MWPIVATGGSRNMLALDPGAEMLKTGSKATKARARKISARKGREPAKTKRGTVTRHQAPSVADLQAQLERRTAELDRALERQTATAEILKVIASSPSDVLPVFEVIVGSAKRLLGGFSAAVVRVIDGIAHLEAITPTNPVADAMTKNLFPRPVVDFQSFAMAQAGKVVQISDTDALSDDIRNIARARGYRSVLLTPMKAASGVIGMINVTRKEAGTFGPEHVELIKTFADQAVIAIENTRLFNETKEALE